MWYFKDKPRGLGLIGSHVFVCLVDFRVGEEVGGLRHGGREDGLEINTS
jgi:hypothetical protein